jgi:site-specific recombinase XerD
MLIVHRRHVDECPHRHKGRDFRKCLCPLWIDWRVGGRRIQKPLGTRDWGVAQIQARKIEVDGLTTTIVPTTVESACDKFLTDAKARQLREASLRKYRQLFGQLKEYSRTRGLALLSNLTTDELVTFRSTWKNSNLSAKKKLELLKAFFRFCTAAKLVPSNPAEGIKPPKIEDAQVMPFSDDDMQKILQSCDAHPSGRGEDRAAQMRALVLLMRHTGLRIGDACTLARDRIHRGLLTLRTEKGGTEVRIPVHPDALEALDKIPKTSPYYFWSGESKRRTVVNIWEDSFKAMFRRAGIAGHSHQLRHTFAVDLLQRGTSLEHVSSLLGHKNLKITQKHYSAFTPGRRDALEDAVRAAWKEPPGR